MARGRVKLAVTFISAFFFSMLLVLPSVFAAPVVNEVMAQGAEWIEVHNTNSDALNLSEWLITDNSATDTLTCLGISGCSLTTNAEYFLIIGNSASIGSITSSAVTYYYTDDAEIGNGLANAADTVNFSNSISAASSNFSYSSSDAVKTWGMQSNGTWTQCTSTPGSLNVCTGSAGQTADVLFPASVYNNGSVFNVNVSLSGYSGTFDVKLEVKNSTSNLGEIFNTQANDWQSSFNYAENAISSSGTPSNYSFKVRVNKDYTGTATLQFKLRDSADHSTVLFTSSLLNVNIVQGIKQAQGQNDDPNSDIEIESFPVDAEFGEVISVEIFAHRGSTSEHTVRAFIEDADGTLVTEESFAELANTFTDYTLTIPVAIKSNCDNRYDETNYTLVVEGLGITREEEINLAGNADSCSSSSGSRTTYAADAPSEIEVGQPFTVSVLINPREDKRLRYSAWSYVYRGNKCYSCESIREENIQYKDLAKRESGTITLNDIMLEGESGEYSIKVKVLKEGLSTPREFTYTVTVTGKEPSASATPDESSSGENLLNQSSLNETESVPGITGNVVYDLRTEQIKNRGLWILVVILLGIISYLIMTRK